MIVLDDLHWADEPSLLLLRRQGGRFERLADPRHLPRWSSSAATTPWRECSATSSGSEASAGSQLRGLTVAAVERYIEMTSGGPAPPGLARAVQEQTDGNPFFVGEIVRLLASEGKLTGGGTAAELGDTAGSPEVVGRRLDRLSERTNEALRIAAAIGRDFESEVVLRVAEMPMEALETAAKEAIAERLVNDLGDRRFSFSHALVRETLYEELSPAKRSALHERIGLAIEEICGDDMDERLGELAHHFLEAAPRGDLAKAIDYARRAGAQDMEQLAYEDAVDVYSRALEVLELMDDPDERLRCTSPGARRGRGEVRPRRGRAAASSERPNRRAASMTQTA